MAKVLFVLLILLSTLSELLSGTCYLPALIVDFASWSQRVLIIKFCENSRDTHEFSFRLAITKSIHQHALFRDRF